MSKKLVAIALVLMLLMTGVVYATGFVGSVRTGDLTVVKGYEAQNGVEIGAGFAVNTQVETELSKEVYDKIAAFLALSDVKAIEYFPLEVQEKIGEILPEDMDAAVLSFYEFMPLDVVNYEVTYGDVKVTFQFPTKFEQEQTIVAVVGIDNGTEIEWTALTAEATEDGDVEVEFTQEVLEAITGYNAVMAILGDTVE